MKNLDFRTAWREIGIILIVFTGILILVATRYPFPSPFDELAQFSAVRSQFENPDLFADTSRYRLVMKTDPALWTTDTNYLNHPALYYLGLAPLLHFGHDVMLTRLANVVLTVAAMIAVIAAGCRILRARLERIVFALLVLSFPKTALVGGMVNNDNLALVAAAAVFAGLTGAPCAALLIAGGLALAGWTKLTALVALAFVVGAKLMMGGRPAILRPQTGLYAVGAVVGLLPFIVTFAETGHLFHINTTVFGLPPEARPVWTVAQYLQFFLTEIVEKWPAAERSLPVGLGIVVVALPLGLAMAGTVTDPKTRAVNLAYIIGAVATLCLHAAYGWYSFQSIGDMTIAQTRYYNVLWPGLALAATVAITRTKYARIAVPVSIIAYLTPTVVGGTFLALLSG